MADEGTATDFAVAAYREEGRWVVVPLPRREAEELDTLVAALRRLPGEAGVLGLVSVADDFFVLLRVRGADVRMLLSDPTAADEWALAEQVLDALDVDEDEIDEDAPAGDTGVLEDVGLPALELSMLADDLDAYPDEVLGRVAARLGFGEEFDRAVEGTI
ncbi:MAG: tRNA adenosine deaminase-associated protein [Motilibacteraceae bacterium]